MKKIRIKKSTASSPAEPKVIKKKKIIKRPVVKAKTSPEQKVFKLPLPLGGHTVQFEDDKDVTLVVHTGLKPDTFKMEKSVIGCTLNVSAAFYVKVGGNYRAVTAETLDKDNQFDAKRANCHTLLPDEFAGRKTPMGVFSMTHLPASPQAQQRLARHIEQVMQSVQLAMSKERLQEVVSGVDD